MQICTKKNKLESKENKLAKTIILHATYHSKDILRKILCCIYLDKCNKIFKELIEIERCIIAYYIPHNLRRLAILSNLKQC